MNKTPLKIKCPSCSCTLNYNDQSPYRPFCSERCQNLDFTGWANERHSIGGSAEYADILSDELDDISHEHKQ